MPWMADQESTVWMLQTYLLLSYFTVHCAAEGHATQTFLHAVKVCCQLVGSLAELPHADVACL